MANENPFSSSTVFSGGSSQSGQGTRRTENIPGGSLRDRYNQNRQRRGQGYQSGSPMSTTPNNPQPQSTYRPPASYTQTPAYRPPAQQYSQPQQQPQQSPQPRTQSYVPPQWAQTQQPMIQPMRAQQQPRLGNYDPGPPQFTMQVVSPEEQAARRAESQDYFARKARGEFQPRPETDFMPDDTPRLGMGPAWGYQDSSRQRG